MAQGLFITFEGGEGAGKTTQMRLLAFALRARGYDVLETREPGGTPEGETLRHLLLDKNGGRWPPLAETLLLFAARLVHVKDVIGPALERGALVLCDRFTDSTKAYQSYGAGLPLEDVVTLERLVLQNFAPDMTLILDIPTLIGLERARMLSPHSDRFEGRDIEFHDRLRQGYLAIAKVSPERCCVIDATGTCDEVQERIMRVMDQKLPNFLKRLNSKKS